MADFGERDAVGHGYGPGDIVELIGGMLRAQSVFPTLA